MTSNEFQTGIEIDGDQGGEFSLTIAEGDDIAVLSVCDTRGTAIDINMSIRGLNDLISTLSVTLSQALENKLG